MCMYAFYRHVLETSDTQGFLLPLTSCLALLPCTMHVPQVQWTKDMSNSTIRNSVVQHVTFMYSTVQI